MERGIGCRLFDRLGRSIRPTRKAEILYPRALGILEEINKITEELALEDQSVSGELIIGASTIPGVYSLPHLATVFKSQHPEISFEIRIADSGEVIDSVLNHDLLLGIVGTKVVSKKLNFFPFIEDELVLAVAANRETPRKISLAELFKLPFLIRESGSGTRKSMEEFGLMDRTETAQLKIVAVLGSS